MLALCFENDAVVQKLAVLSMLEVFKDIIPGCGLPGVAQSVPFIDRLTLFLAAIGFVWLQKRN